MNYLLPASSAFILTVLLILIALRVFPKLGLMDRPAKYGLTRKPVPYPGGILLFFVFTALVLIFFEPTLKMLGLLLGGGILVLTSFIDDRVELPALLRLSVQTVVALIMVAVGIGVTHISNPFGGAIPLDGISFNLVFGDTTVTVMLVSAIFTLIWILAVVNTLNWLDGIPGMVSGITTIGCVTLFLLSVSPVVNQPEVATLAIIVGMMAFAFWWFDFYPPKIIIGDSGSMFFGLMLAVLAIFSGGKIATAFLILGFPIMDALYVIVYRLYNRQAPWKGGEWDKYRKAVHLHHRLLQSGYTEREALAFVYLVCTVFGITALFLGTKGKFWAIVVLFAASFVVGLVLRAKGRK